MGMGWLVRGCGELGPLGLQLFEWMEQQRFMGVLIEVAAVGQGGLQINKPSPSRSLRPCRDLERSSPCLLDPRGPAAAGLRRAVRCCWSSRRNGSSMAVASYRNCRWPSWTRPANRFKINQQLHLPQLPDH